MLILCTVAMNVGSRCHLPRYENTFKCTCICSHNVILFNIYLNWIEFGHALFMQIFKINKGFDGLLFLSPLSEGFSDFLSCYGMEQRGLLAKNPYTCTVASYYESKVGGVRSAPYDAKSSPPLTHTYSNVVM